MMVMVTSKFSKFTKILVLKGEEEVQGKCEENIADDRNDDDSGGHIGTKNPVLNYWNKIYRGSDFVFGSTIGEIGEVGEHNASIRGASEA